MTGWEYTKLTAAGQEATLELMQEMGQKGWRVCAVEPLIVSGQRLVWFMRRLPRRSPVPRAPALSDQVLRLLRCEEQARNIGFILKHVPGLNKETLYVILSRLSKRNLIFSPHTGLYRAVESIKNEKHPHRF